MQINWRSVQRAAKHVDSLIEFIDDTDLGRYIDQIATDVAAALNIQAELQSVNGHPVHVIYESGQMVGNIRHLDYCKSLVQFVLKSNSQAEFETNIREYWDYQCLGEIIKQTGRVTYTGGQLFVQLQQLADYVREVEISDKIVAIDDAGLSNLSSLVSIIWSSQLQHIGKGAFVNDYHLQQLQIPDSVVSLGESAFMWCSGLVDIQLSSEIKEIPADAFAYCKRLQTIDLSNIIYVRDRAFSDCRALSEAVLSDDLEIIGDYAFSNCPNLTISTNNPIAIEYAEKEGIPVVSVDNDIVIL